MKIILLVITRILEMMITTKKKKHKKRSDYDLFVQIIIFEDMTLFF